MPIAPPLIILGSPRSYSTVICAVLGQHPQMFSILESRLFNVETMREWWRTTKHQRPDGLLRDVAEVIFGHQTEATIERARGWLWRRRTWDTGDIFRALAECLYPLGLVEKTPIAGLHDEKIQEILQRRLRVFPHARLLHLVRHPQGQCQSHAEQAKKQPRLNRRLLDRATHPPVLDPQLIWYRVNANILTFLATLPPEQHRRIRGEDLLSDPDYHLLEITRWLGLRMDPVAIEEMKHPERSPFARVGPWNARAGGDGKFFRNPALRIGQLKELSLEGALPWRGDDVGFRQQVRELAQQFGYK
jgi:Sulfotransferase family